MTVKLKIQIDFRSHEPIYLQIIDQIKQKVVSGELQEGDQLPTVRQLAADMRINFNTVARSYRMLDEEGIISTQHGRGTFIIGMPSEENGEALRLEAVVKLTQHYLAEVARLDVSPEDIKEIFNQNLSIWQETGSLPQSDNT